MDILNILILLLIGGQLYGFLKKQPDDYCFSEGAALDCSYVEYHRAGYSDLMQTVPIHNGYPRSYYVPKNYGFSTITYFENLILRK